MVNICFGDNGQVRGACPCPVHDFLIKFVISHLLSGSHVENLNDGLVWGFRVLSLEGEDFIIRIHENSLSWVLLGLHLEAILDVDHDQIGLFFWIWGWGLDGDKSVRFEA